MADMDQAIKRLLQRHPRPLFGYLLPGLTALSPLSTDVALERQLVLDSLFRARYEGTRCLANLEANTEGQAGMVPKLRHYAQRAQSIYDLPVFSLMLLFTPKGKRYLPDSPYEEWIGKRHRVLLNSWKYFPIRLYEWPARDIMEKEIWALLPLVPLMEGADLATDRAAMQCIKEKVPKAEQATTATLLAIFMARRYNRYLAKQILEEVFMSNKLLEESPLYHEWVDAAREEGKAQGKVLGIEEGKAQGKVFGIAEALIKMYAERFGMPPAAEIQHALLASEASLLESLTILLVRPTSTPEQFRQALGL